MTKPLTLDESVALIEEFGPNCLLGVCCPPASQRRALMEALVGAIEKRAAAEHGGELRELSVAKAAADFILDHFDLAPKDSITPLLRKAGELARERP